MYPCHSGGTNGGERQCQRYQFHTPRSPVKSIQSPPNPGRAPTYPAI